MRKPSEFIVFPLDVPDRDQAMRYVQLLKDHVGLFKVGLELFISAGPAVLDAIHEVAGHKVFLEPRDAGNAKSKSTQDESLIAYRVRDLNLGEIGEIIDHIPNEMNPVWLIDRAGEEIIIPASADFIKKIDHKNGILHLDLPDGITEL